MLSRLCVGRSNSGCRAFNGRITIRGRGNRNKINYRFVDYFRRVHSIGIILKTIYDPNRTARISYVVFLNGLGGCYLTVKTTFGGSYIHCGSKPYVGEKYAGLIKATSQPLFYMRLFSTLNNLELRPFFGGQLCRTAGSSCTLIGKSLTHGVIKLKSGWQMKLPLDSMATTGVLEDPYRIHKCYRKAGIMRNFGFKSKVRGVAKNPCDHPHGGGNGKKSKPVVPVNAWSTVFKWKPTKNKQFELKKKRRFKNLKGVYENT